MQRSFCPRDRHCPRSVDNVNFVDIGSTQEADYVEVGILDALRGDRLAQYSIRISDQWRLCLRSEDGNAFDVEIGDYH